LSFFSGNAGVVSVISSSSSLSLLDTCYIEVKTIESSNYLENYLDLAPCVYNIFAEKLVILTPTTTIYAINADQNIGLKINQNQKSKVTTYLLFR
jgi:hypothetical protein